jgi:hypothetical protein
MTPEALRFLANIDTFTLSPIRKVWIHGDAFAASRLVTKATAVDRKAVFRLPHRALSREQALSNESHPIHRIQELPGSALRQAMATARAPARIGPRSNRAWSFFSR